ncbi:hypothetical protein [Vibrio gangliei]|uniref:hypothetical protein n=1 Tax=Vibrio gangliei TaxID=2077090 RepID=UPI000D01A1CE|nr:hypothetical protein [Vibrio gangliei]
MSIDPSAIPDSAVQHSSNLAIQSFFNSFSMETPECRVAQHHLYIPLGEQQLVLPLSYASALGRHRYQGHIYLIHSSELDDERQVGLNIINENKIDFSQAVSLLVSHYYRYVETQTLDRFFNRVGESTRYIDRPC